MLSCDEVEELLPAYALGALSADERAAVDEHLATCAEHADDLAALRGVAAALPLAGEEMEPPARLLDRIHAQIGAVEAAPAAPIAIATRRTARWMPAVALAAALMLVSLVLWRGGFVSFGSAIERTGTSGAVAGRLAYRVNTQRAELSLSGLATPPAGRAYQAWVIRPGLAPEPYGLLEVNGSEGRVVIQTPLAAGDTVAVTLEPANGSAVPTSSPVFALPF